MQTPQTSSRTVDLLFDARHIRQSGIGTYIRTQLPHLQAAADRVRSGYAGEPVEDVCRRLLDETRSGLHPDIAAGFQPDMDEFCRVAVAIVRGELT